MRIIVVHGGVGLVQPEPQQQDYLIEAAECGCSVLKEQGDSLLAVEKAIAVLESSGRFNAGQGSYHQMDGKIRMDASLMDGSARRVGSVISLEGISNPITVARLIAEETPHIALSGDNATRFALHYGMDVFDRSAETRNEIGQRPIPEFEQTRILYRRIFGADTVGAVALDDNGNVAAGASTGGLPGMLPGRVGDVPLVGCGIYAGNRSAAVSCSGLGESIVRSTLARHVCFNMELGLSVREAAEAALNHLVRDIGGFAGLIAVNPQGEIAVRHSTTHMLVALKIGDTEPIFGANQADFSGKIE